MSFDSQVQGVTGVQARSLASSPEEPENPLGGKMNEYGRINLQVRTEPPPAPPIKQAGEKFTYDEAGNLVAVDALGDMNCDGVTDNWDINAFVMALTDPAQYAETFPNCAIELGDINGDGTVDTNDINLFIAMVNNGLVQAQRYEYDEENRLTRIATINDTTILELRYDALGRRVEALDYTQPPDDPCRDANGAVRTRYVYSGLETIEEYVLCGPPEEPWVLAREFIWGADHTEPLALIDWTDAGDQPAGTAEVLHYVQDALGSVVALTDAGDPDALPDPIPPAVVERYEYDAYGRTYIEDAAGTRHAASQYGNPFMWTGQRYDAGVKLYAFPARTYSPELGRWFQRDPLGFVDGVNLYEYVRSMPTKLTDPLGLAAALGDPGGGGPSGGGDPPPPPPNGGDGPQPDGCEGGNSGSSGAEGGGEGGADDGGEGADDGGSGDGKEGPAIGGHTPGRDHDPKTHEKKKDRFRKKQSDKRKQRHDDNVRKWREWDKLNPDQKKLRPDLRPKDPRPPEVPEPRPWTISDYARAILTIQGILVRQAVDDVLDAVRNPGRSIDEAMKHPILPPPPGLPIPSLGPRPAE